MRERWDQVWRGSRYLLIGLPTALATMLVLPLLMVGAISTALGVGLMLFPRIMAGLRLWGEWHRRRAAAVLGVSVAPRHATLPKGVRAQWRQLLDDGENRRDVRWVLWHIATGLPAGLAALCCVGLTVGAVVAASLWWLFPADEPLSLLVGIPVTSWGSALPMGALQLALGVALTWWAVPRLARWDARACLAALEPSAEDQLAERVGVLTESRAGVLDAHGAELRRIERDLHDGTQARLVAIAMRLGVAREALPDDSGALAKLLQEAHEGTEEAMTELRDVIRTMYPPILADRGLEGALASLTAGSAIPAELDLGELGRLPAAVEAAAYFIVAETLTNAAKHSGATRVTVRMSRRGGRLLIEVTDDGLGGADESRGTGLVGIRRRVAALDGTVLVASPVGGPTAVTVELPCAS
ncbi:sensor histidine kinase [Nonomuraea africana]|uniref:histidine kinase n=1 Tax=Nonomuraea africana TaxID=46171 RepID=A0ABR9KT84_9ACTN|nr:sensor histidine kinase [Nonomuraea africana]MBE1565253.1 signal transduction histidine kinase [Nonomuraea africana]